MIIYFVFAVFIISVGVAGYKAGQMIMRDKIVAIYDRQNALAKTTHETEIKLRDEDIVSWKTATWESNEDRLRLRVKISDLAESVSVYQANKDASVIEIDLLKKENETIREEAYQAVASLRAKKSAEESLMVELKVTQSALKEATYALDMLKKTARNSTIVNKIVDSAQTKIRALQPVA